MQYETHATLQSRSRTIRFLAVSDVEGKALWLKIEYRFCLYISSAGSIEEVPRKRLLYLFLKSEIIAYPQREGILRNSLIFSVNIFLDFFFHDFTLCFYETVFVISFSTYYW